MTVTLAGLIVFAYLSAISSKHMVPYVNGTNYYIICVVCVIITVYRLQCDDMGAKVSIQLQVMYLQYFYN